MSARIICIAKERAKRRQPDPFEAWIGFWFWFWRMS